jgi:DNA-binding MarR family transcriptional regulator
MGEVRWLDDLESRAWRSLLAAHSRLVADLDDELMASQGLSLNEYGVLVTLSEAPDDRLRMSELAEELHISPSGLTRRLDGLVRAGLVERLQCPDDRRGSYAVLTPAGRLRIEQAAPDHVEQVRRHFIDRLDRRQLAALVEALQEVEAHPGVSSPLDWESVADPTIALAIAAVAGDAEVGPELERESDHVERGHHKLSRADRRSDYARASQQAGTPCDVPA